MAVGRICRRRLFFAFSAQAHEKNTVMRYALLVFAVVALTSCAEYLTRANKYAEQAGDTNLRVAADHYCDGVSTGALARLNDEDLLRNYFDHCKAMKAALRGRAAMPAAAE